MHVRHVRDLLSRSKAGYDILNLKQINETRKLDINPLMGERNERLACSCNVYNCGVSFGDKTHII